MKKKQTNKIKIIKQAEWSKVLRSEINTPDYNPRKISNEAADKLRKQIKEDGLVDAIVINKRTMNVVGGNQRTAQLDRIYRYIPGESDYQLNVQMIDVDELTEIKINTRLNNPDAMGEFDSEKLFDIMSEFEINPLIDFNMDRITIDFMANEYGMDNPLNEIAENIKQVRDTTLDRGDTNKKMRKIKQTELQKKQEENESGNSEYMENDDYIVTIVFNSNQEKRTFMGKIGRPKTEKFTKASFIRDALKEEYL